MAYKLQMPAIRGQQSGREFYVAVVPFGLLPKLFFYNEEFVPSEMRSQRELNEKRVPEIANYVLNNDDWLFSSLTATVSGELAFNMTDINNPDVGILEVDMNATFIINDGQHRRAGIIEAMKQNPELQRENISVVIYPFENIGRSNQMFADLNRYAQKPTKSLNVLYDSRDPLSQATSDMVKSIAIFERFTDKDRVSLPAKSPRLFTLGSIYEANRYLLKINKRKLREFSEQDTRVIISYWQEVADNMQLWSSVLKGDMKAWELREGYVCSHSVVIQALGLAGAYVLGEADWQENLQALQNVDWRRTNREWKGIAIAGTGRVVNSKPVTQLTAIFLRKKLGLSINLTEQKQLDAAGN